MNITCCTEAVATYELKMEVLIIFFFRNIAKLQVVERSL